jgi:hypothetical protein
MIYWTELWVVVLTAGLAFAIWHQLCLLREMGELRLELGCKQDKRPFTPKPRARRVDTVFHDRDDEGREHWLCVKCGASVPKMGHTVKACEEEQAKPENQLPALPAAEDAAKAAHEIATGGLELPDASGTPSAYVSVRPRYSDPENPTVGGIVGYNCAVCGDDVPMEGHTERRCEEVRAELAKGSNTEMV